MKGGKGSSLFWYAKCEVLAFVVLYDNNYDISFFKFVSIFGSLLTD